MGPGYSLGDLQVTVGYFPVRGAEGRVESVLVLEAGRAFSSARDSLRRALWGGVALSERDKESLEDVLGEVERLRRLTEDLLDLSADRPLATQRVALPEVLEEAARATEAAFPGVTVRRRMSDPMGFMRNFQPDGVPHGHWEVCLRRAARAARRV